MRNFPSYKQSKPSGQYYAIIIGSGLGGLTMAAMLGISVDSVHKTRQRLRQRLQFSSDTNLDEYISGI